MTGPDLEKTECFLLPILAKLAREASESDESFATPAMRALVLYPMNALVNDPAREATVCSAIRG